MNNIYNMNINLLFTLNKNYLPQLVALLRSYNLFHPNIETNIFILTSNITKYNFTIYDSYFSKTNKFHIIKIPNDYFNDAPITKRYPKEMYYRIFASLFLPKNINKILYLDPDIIINGSLLKLYNMNISNYYFIGASNVGHFITRFNQIKNGASKDSKYINTGVMLMNIKKLRKEQNINDVYDYIKNHQLTLTLPDQDIISALYGEKILLIDNLIYNLSDRIISQYNFKHFNSKQKIDLKWVDENTKIIHYFGRNKPWRKKYRGILDVYYNRFKIK